LSFLVSSAPHFFLSVCVFHVVSIFLTGGSFGECLNISDHLVSNDTKSTANLKNVEKQAVVVSAEGYLDICLEELV